MQATIASGDSLEAFAEGAGKGTTVEPAHGSRGRSVNSAGALLSCHSNPVGSSSVQGVTRGVEGHGENPTDWEVVDGRE